MNDFFTNWRHAVRRVMRDPGLSLFVVVNLTLGIGATTAVFSLVNALLVRPMPGLGDPAELVSITPRPVQIPGLLHGSFRVPISYPHFRTYEKGGQALVGLAAHQPIAANVVLGEAVERLHGEVVSANYFSVLRVDPAIGRLLAVSAAWPDGEPDVVVLGYRLWKVLLGGDPQVVGRVVRINGTPLTVVGVAPDGFRGTRVDGDPQFWVSVAAAPRLLPTMELQDLSDPRQGWFFSLVGRLGQRSSLETAQQEMDAITTGLRRDGASEEEATGLEIHHGVGVEPSERAQARESLAVLLAVVGFLLLISCLNTAILLLSRVRKRQVETSVRMALGAERRKIIEGLLAESCLLGLLGAAGGVLLTLLSSRAFSRLDFAGFLPDVGRVAVDLRVLAFAVGVGIASSILSGLAPALRTTRVDLAEILKQGQRVSGRGSRKQHLLVVTQIASSLMLLIGAGLLTRSLRNYQEIATGFDTEGVLSLRYDLESQGYEEPAGRIFHRRVLEAVSALPGVEGASLASSVPLGRGESRAVAQISPTSGPLAGEQQGWATYNLVSPRYLRTLGIRLVKGRDFASRDDERASPVVVVSESLAEKYWPGMDPLDQRMTVADREARVVGVAGDVRSESLTGLPEPHFYRPLFQEYRPVATLHVRSEHELGQVLTRVEAIVRELNPHLPLFSRGRLIDQVSVALARPRLAANFVGLFALLGLSLTVIGVSGVMYRTAKSSLWESSIRMALGARRSDLVWLFLRRALVAVAAGVVVGLAGGLALSRTLASFLYGVSPHEPYVFVGVVSSLVLIAMVANGVPAWLATRLDPAEVLRQE